MNKTKESQKLAKRAFAFFYETIKTRLPDDETPSGNDLIILRESARLLKSPDRSIQYQELVNELKN